MAKTKNSKETLAQRLRIIDRNGLPGISLDGCPVGGWAQTQQAMQRLEDSLPAADERNYTVAALVRACYREDSAGRYRWDSVSFDRWVSQ